MVLKELMMAIIPFHRKGDIMKIIKTKMGFIFILLTSFLIFSLPTATQDESAADTAVLEQAYASYLDQQKRFEKIAEIEADKDAVVHELAAKWETVARERGNDEYTK